MFSFRQDLPVEDDSEELQRTGDGWADGSVRSRCQAEGEDDLNIKKLRIFFLTSPPSSVSLFSFSLISVR